MNEQTQKITDDIIKIHEGKLSEPHEHESDGLMYMSHPPQMKCKICGQFYR